MKVAVITPIYRENALVLDKMAESVKNQTYPVTHILVYDGPENFLTIRNEDNECQKIYSRTCHANYGDTPKWIGVMAALAQGFDAIAFVDADDWIMPNHIENGVKALQESGAKVCVMGRSLHRPDGSLMEIDEGNDEKESHFVLMLADTARQLLSLGCKPKQLCEIGDRIMHMALRTRNIPVVFCPERTYCYSTLWKVHYDAAKEPYPEGAKDNMGNGFEQWKRDTPQPEKDKWSRLIFGKHGLL